MTFINGTPGNDVLQGTGNADITEGRDGNDQLEMGRGDDTVIAVGFGGIATRARMRGAAPRRESGCGTPGDRPQAAPAPDGTLVWTDVDATGVTTEIVITRSCAAPPWSEADIALLTYLGPHIGRALRLDRRLAAEARDGPPALPTATSLLSEREKDCLVWIARGATSKLAARQLSVSSHTVDEHVRSAIAKLGVTNRTAAAAVAVAHGLINI
jgi:DNA-binding CsgD family transcriptional regulator